MCSAGWQEQFYKKKFKVTGAHLKPGLPSGPSVAPQNARTIGAIVNMSTHMLYNKPFNNPLQATLTCFSGLSELLSIDAWICVGYDTSMCA